MTYYIGMDIGGTNIRIGHGREDGELLGFERFPREAILHNNGFSKSLANLVKQYVKQYSLTKVEAIGIGLPSILSLDRRIVLQTPNIPGMNQIPIADELEDLLNIPVYLEKDTNVLFLNDSQGMMYEGMAVGIYIGTGIGNALFMDGRPYKGKHGVAGEIGHIPIPGNEDICGCGNKGCSECIASGTYLRRLQKENFSDTELEALFHVHGTDSRLIHYVDNIASVVAAEINILDPEFVIIGGGIPQMMNFPKGLLIKQIHEHCRKPYPQQGLNIIFSTGGQQSGVRGGIILAASTNKDNANIN